MAEAVLLGIAKSVLGQLSSPALNEFLLVWNCKKDLKRLTETIEIITCFIHDAEQRQSKERVVKLWLSRLSSVLYEADDLFDVIDARALRKKTIDGSTFKKEVTLFFSKSNQLSFLIKIAHDIKAIRECLDGIRDDMSPFQFQYEKIEEKRFHSVLEREESHSFVDNKDVIGRDREKQDIINLLLSDDRMQQNLEVISVIGFGGLGKTTLAQLVYNDERVQKGFDMCLWSCINYFSDLESVLVKILKSKFQELHLDQLQRELREKIQGKKYLLVLDDVWDENASNWSKLETLLSCGKAGSKVLITTRKTRVAQCLDAIEPYYRLNMLSEESAWSLFVKMAFKDGKFDGDSDLVLAGKQIVQKCGYVPLALSTIGRMLRYRKKDKKEWLSFLEKEFAEVVSDDTDDGKLMQVLMVSYNDLPLALKHCFAYCSVFPKDHEFEKDELVCMWLAQGFVEPHDRKSLEEVGDDYFFYLVDRCFFQVVEVYGKEAGIFEKYKCKMHDLLHDLAIHVTKGNVDMGTALHHISVTCSASNTFDYSNCSSLLKSLRTLRLIDVENIQIYSIEFVLDRFRMLRTLVLSKLKLEALPDSFEGLIHLRYLDLSQNPKLIALPNSICKLYHLQTLLLAECPKLMKLPSRIMKLVSLRHLFLTGCTSLDYMPSGIALLTTLVSLDQFIVHPDHGGLRYMGGLDKLCGMLNLQLPLDGWTDFVEDARNANMQNKCRLNGLSINWINRDDERELTGEETKEILEELQPNANLQCFQLENYISDKLPSWISSLSSVKKITLRNCDLEFLDVSVGCGYLLPSLEILEMYDMDWLRGWWREATSPRDNTSASTITLPRVSKLTIIGCTNLVENMPSFEVVEELYLSIVNVRLVNMLLSNPNVQHSLQCHGYSSKLQVLKLRSVVGLECLSEGLIKHLTALKKLSIRYCRQLSWVSRRGLACLSCLEKMTIMSAGSVRLEDEDEGNKRPYMKINNNINLGLQKLRRLRVPWQCHLLQEGLEFLTSLQYLHITYYEAQQVEADNKCCKAIRWQGLENLQRVTVIFELKSCCFPMWALHLPCLQNLSLEQCGVMNSDDWAAQQTQLTSLLNLQIQSNQKEPLWAYDIPWKLLPSLRTLELTLRLSTIPEGIQELNSLQCLTIWDYQNLKEIPKWMINMTSLHKLDILQCSQELEERCKPGTGIDWHLISHIQTIYVRRRCS